MKKVVILILALIMVFGIVGCSSAPAEETTSTPQPTEETTQTPEATPEPITELNIGETVSNAIAEFTLERLEFGESLHNINDDEFLLPNDIKGTSKNPFCADEGNMMVSMSYTIKNTGKEEIDLYAWSFDIMYDDGYMFSKDTINEYYLYDDKWENNQDGRYISPLSSKEYRNYIQVPKEVYENKDKSLCFAIHMFVPTENKDDYDIMSEGVYYKEQVLTYRIR